jgi:uncharacterized glyoxalase superfamily protein PhnB
VIFVQNVEGALSHYLEVFAFAEDWTVREGESLIAAQVSRDGLEIILYHDESRAGGGRIFMSLKPGDVASLMKDFESRGSQVSDGHWGMPIMYVKDLDDNELYFYDDKLNEKT